MQKQSLIEIIDKIQRTFQKMIQKKPKHPDQAFQWMILQDQQFAQLHQRIHHLIEKQGKQADPSELQTAIVLRDHIRSVLIAHAKTYTIDLQDHYPIPVNLDELLQDPSKQSLIFKYGIVHYANREHWVQKAYDDVLRKTLPSSPELEYPSARSIHRHFIIHSGPTNSGKTHQSLERLKQAQAGVYLSPLRLLALEVYEKLNMDGVPCSLATGEEELLIPFSNHLACTIEKMSEFHRYDVAVIDEAQMLTCDQRGFAWTRAILGAFADEVHVCCAPHAVPMVIKLIESCGDSHEVHHHERATPLIVETKLFQFPRDCQSGDALIAFSRKEVLAIAETLKKKGILCSVIYGSLPPEARRKQVELFATGVHHVVVATDAIGMGLNLPIKRIVFMDNEKFDGVSRRPLLPQEIKQIAGRAGRRGLYEQGYVTALSDLKHIRNGLNQADPIIDTLYIAPQEQVILQIAFGNLREKLIAWYHHELSTDGFQKMNLDERLQLLEELDRMNTTLSEQLQFRAIGVPFPRNDWTLLDEWKRHVRAIERGEGALRLPVPPNANRGEIPLHVWEQYYRKIDLYYSMSRAFEKKMNEQWVTTERKFVIEKIHELLVRNQKKKSAS